MRRRVSRVATVHVMTSTFLKKNDQSTRSYIKCDLSVDFDSCFWTAKRLNPCWFCQHLIPNSVCSARLQSSEMLLDYCNTCFEHNYVCLCFSPAGLQLGCVPWWPHLKYVCVCGECNEYASLHTQLAVCRHGYRIVVDKQSGSKLGVRKPMAGVAPPDFKRWCAQRRNQKHKVIAYSYMLIVPRHT